MFLGLKNIFVKANLSKAEVKSLNGIFKYLYLYKIISVPCVFWLVLLVLNITYDPGFKWGCLGRCIYILIPYVKKWVFSAHLPNKGYYVPIFRIRLYI